MTGSFITAWAFLLAVGQSQAAQVDTCSSQGAAVSSALLQHATPETAGWSSPGLDSIHQYAAEIGSTSVMLIESGNVVLAWGDVDKPHNILSIRKSLVGALYGIAVQRGQIDLSATLSDLGIDDSPPLTEQERTAQVGHLLKSRSGVYHPAAYETSGMVRYRPERDRYQTGTHWFYNNWDFNTLATIYQNATNEDVFVAFDRELARPLGMKDFSLEHTRFRVERDKSIHPAYLFFMSARDLARFGQLWLQQGCWGKRSLVPTAWVRASVTSYSKAYDGGYGYASWWTYPAYFADEYRYDQLRHYDSYMTTGTGGQVIWVIPDLALVFVHQHEIVNDSAVGAPEYWTLLDRILAARKSAPSADPNLVPLQSRPLPARSAR